MTKSVSFLPSQRAPAGGTSTARVTVDSLVQGSLVELFAAYGVALAPLPRAAPASWAVPEVSSSAAFRHQSAGEAGRLTLSLSTALLDQMKPTESTAVKMDWARELANQLLGRIKNRLLPFGVQLEIGALSLVSSQMLQHELERAVGFRVYAARTLRGLVLVTLRGLPEDSALTYVGPPSATEGTIIWL